MSSLLASANAEEWPHFLGPHHDTSVREPGIRTRFPDSGFPLLWQQSVGGGYSSPAVANDRVFVMDRLAKPYVAGEVSGNLNFIRAEIPGQERVRALDASSGRLLWEHIYECPYTSVYTYAIGPRCTPTIDGKHVYTLGAEGNLICFESTTGTVAWSRDFKKDYGLEIPEWGCAAHPLVVDDLLVCIVGGQDSTVVAFDKLSGMERWRALSASKPGYCPPIMTTIHGLEQLLVWHGDGLASLDASNGSLHWFTEIKPLYGMTIGAPRVYGDLIHVMGFNGVSAAIKVAQDNRSASVIWGPDRRKGVAGVLNTAHLDSGGYLYSAGGRQDFRCVNIRTGERLWETTAPLQDYRGNRTTSWPSTFSFHHPPSGRTFLYNDHGEFISATLSPDGYREHSRASLMEPTHLVGGRRLVWSAPAFADRKLYLRNDLEMRCYDLSKNHSEANRVEALLDAQQDLIDSKGTLSNVFRLAREGRTIYEHAMNSQHPGDLKITEETLFPIWSMTKPITSVAAMILLERGGFQLDEAVSGVLPELATLRVKSHSRPDETEALERPITYRDLLRHTSGLYGYDGSFDEEGTWKEVMELPDLAALIDLIVTKPLEHQPGERYTYGLSTAVLGAALEKLTGQTLEAFLSQTLFEPLGMTDTKFSLSEEDRTRFQPLFVKIGGGFRRGTTAEDELYYTPGSQLFLGGEGLISTLADYGRFCQFLLDRGRDLNGRALISEETLALMLEDQLQGISGFGGSENGYVMGFGFETLQDASKSPSGAPVGIYGWGGYHTTHFWIDPLNSQYGLFFARRYPFFDQASKKLQEVVYAKAH